MIMHASLRALFAGIIDYAGLFPPARLPLDQAIRNYARYRQERGAWMLGRFVCPAARLQELAPFIEEAFSSQAPLLIAALGRGGNDAAAFGSGLRADLEQIAAFQLQHGARVKVETLETRLPVNLSGLVLDLAQARQLAEELELQALASYYELASESEWRDVGNRLMAQLGLAGKPQRLAEDMLRLMTQVPLLEGRVGRKTAGLKLRCGGLDAAAFPSPDHVAHVIVMARDTRLPLKFTAGLHHPLRHFDTGLQTHVHGFLNVFTAGVLARAGDLSEEQVRQIIEDEDAGNFVFTADELRWREHRATVLEIIEARRHGVTSFGSCSFDEPCADLRALGLLDS
jgi:hypothetical protein